MQKGFLKQVKRGTALIAAFALTVSGITAADVQNVQAASKAPSLSASKISIKKGKTKKVTVKKKKNVTVKKVTWKINSGKNIVKFDKKTNTYARIKALKKGKAVVSAKIKVGKKTYTRKVTVTVTETKKPVNPTKAPATEAPTKAPATEAPTKAPVTDTPATDTPVTDTPATEAPTKAPEAPATEAPATEAPTKAPAKETATPYPYITAQPDPTAVPDYLDGIKTVKASWNDGTICNLSPNYAGKKMKITLLVKEVGEENPSGNVMIKSNYNGYPTLATVALSTEWTPVEIEYRFNNFTGSNPVLYFDDENKGVVTDNMTLYYKDLNFEELEGVDLLGGTALTKASWHKGVLGSFVKATHENKQVRISFKLREKGVENPSGTCDVQSNYPGSTYPTLKTGIPLTTDWTEVSFDTTIGTIGNQYPSIYLNGSAITDDMEMFMDEFKIEVIGDAPATPTPEVTPEPAGPTPVSHDVNIQGENAYDSAKGGIYVETTGATAWGTAFGKYGANYGLTDKTFSSVIVDLEFYKEGSKVTSIDAAECISVTVSSDGSDWGNSANKEKQEYNVGAGQTTLSGTNMVANAVVFQWKKAAADITAYDAILIKSIKLVE